MDGCINDVGVKNLLTAYTPSKTCAPRQEELPEDMYALMQRVRKVFLKPTCW